MKSIFRQLEELADADLYVLSEAVDLELQRRDDNCDEAVDSARRRVQERGQSYRHRTGASAPPVRIVGLTKLPPRRAA